MYAVPTILYLYIVGTRYVFIWRSSKHVRYLPSDIILSKMGNEIAHACPPYMRLKYIANFQFPLHITKISVTAFNIVQTSYVNPSLHYRTTRHRAQCISILFFARIYVRLFIDITHSHWRLARHKFDLLAYGPNWNHSSVALIPALFHPSKLQ